MEGENYNNAKSWFRCNGRTSWNLSIASALFFNVLLDWSRPISTTGTFLKLNSYYHLYKHGGTICGSC